MPYSNDFRLLIEDAMEAVEDLVKHAAPDSFSYLRLGYGEMRRGLECDDDDLLDLGRDQKTQLDITASRVAQRAARAKWTGLTIDDRQNLIVSAIGGDRCSLHEITERVNQALVGPEAEWRAVYEEGLRPVVLEIFERGEIDRDDDARTKRRRFVYFRRRGLDGPIAELERAFQAKDCDRVHPRE